MLRKICKKVGRIYSLGKKVPNVRGYEKKREPEEALLKLQLNRDYPACLCCHWKNNPDISFTAGDYSSAFARLAIFSGLKPKCSNTSE